jgi:hypothetical protein
MSGDKARDVGIAASPLERLLVITLERGAFKAEGSYTCMARPTHDVAAATIELEDAYGEIESLQVRISQMGRGLSEYEANEDAWPDVEARARHNRVTERMADRG